MITQREIVSHKVSESLIERAGSFGIMLDDISLVSVNPPSQRENLLNEMVLLSTQNIYLD